MTATIRGCELAYDVSPTISERLAFVWGHGLTSSRAGEADFSPLDFERMAKHRTIVRYDARGHGESGELNDPAAGNWSELALDQVALIDHLGLDRVALGGASMGAATALHSALSLGERVERLVLVIPPTAWETRQAQIDQYETMASIVDARGVEPLVAGIRTAPIPDPFSDGEEWIERRIDSLRATDPKRLAAVFRGAGKADLPSPAQLRAIQAPTLVLAWTGDPGHPVSTAERLAELLPDAEVSIASTRADFDAWTDAVDAFLARHT